MRSAVRGQIGPGSQASAAERLGAVAVAIGLALALAPGAAEAGACQAKACCHKPNVWAKTCLRKFNSRGGLGPHCPKWKMECRLPVGDLR
jgi:hypothetical protein